MYKYIFINTNEIISKVIYIYIFLFLFLIILHRNLDLHHELSHLPQIFHKKDLFLEKPRPVPDPGNTKKNMKKRSRKKTDRHKNWSFAKNITNIRTI